jgi:hypothetical protein
LYSHEHERKERRMYGLILAAVLALSGSPAVDVPHSIVHSRDAAASTPVWVSLSKAVDASGVLRWDVLGAEAQANFEQVARNVPSTPSGQLPQQQERYDLRSSGSLPACVYYGPSFRSFAAEPRESIEQLTRSAAWVARGRVTAVTPGFFDGEPFSLLTVEVGRTLIGTTGRTAYVLYPYAQFRAGDVAFCKDDALFPHIPAAGDQIAIFAPRGTTGLEVPLLIPDRNFVVFESQGRLVVSPEWADHTIHSLNDLEAAVLRTH